MKICKLKIATSIITAFVIAFAVIPYMGTANNVYAAGSSYEQAADVIDENIYVTPLNSLICQTNL